MTTTQTDQPSPLLSEAQPPVPLKLIESNDESSMMIAPANKLIDEDELKNGQETNGEVTEIDAGIARRQHRSNSLSSSSQHAFPLNSNGLSDWDSTDSESGGTETHPNDEPESGRTAS